MEVQSNENAALLKLLKTKSRTKTELLKVSSARRRVRQAALDALLAEGKVIRIDKEYFANDPSGSAGLTPQNLPLSRKKGSPSRSDSFQFRRLECPTD